MSSTYAIHFPDQLRPHLRALRKARGLTQAQLGALVGVSQARVAEIEANPGLVNFEQLMKLLSVLGVTVELHAQAPAKVPADRPRVSARPRANSARTKARGTSKADEVPAPRTTFVVRSKKGSW